MIPEIDTQLAAVMKSLADNVLPAVDAGNPMASEQIRLCLATLGIVRSRLPQLHRYLRQELSDNRALALSIVAVLPDAQASLDADIAAADRVLADAGCGASDIESQVRSLKSAIVAAQALARGSDRQAAVRALVLAAQQPMILRNRAWTVGMGFEPDPTQVPDLDRLLSRDTAR